LNWDDKQKTIDLTPQNPYDRYEDGRPKVPDGIIERMKHVTSEEAWGVLNSNDYKLAFEGDWQILHPDRVLVGRAVTCRFVPSRPDLNEVIEAKGAEEGRIGGQNSWAIDTLQPNDVIVVDLFGKIVWGTFAGDNLATAIATNTEGGGMVVYGGMRDYQRVVQIDNFNGFIKGLDPTPIRDVTLVEINVPIRVGDATCLPGDVVLGTPTGVTFVPPHLAEAVVERSENVRLRDYFGQMRIREGIYTPGEVDRKWSEQMEADYEEWGETHDLETEGLI
jgi:regulator of RNase E activity RraA